MKSSIFTEHQKQSLVDGETVIVYGNQGAIGRKYTLVFGDKKYYYTCSSWYTSISGQCTSAYKLIES